MPRFQRTVPRVMLVPALLLCLMLAGSTPAAAYTPPNDHTTGQTAHYDFRDGAYGPYQGNVDCEYHLFSNGQYRIDRFVLRAPWIWWSDTDSDTTHEHGTVGWRYRLQETSDPDDVPFATVYRSGIQKRTAYEDHPLNSDGDKAPFSTRTLRWSNGHTVYYRIKYTIYYYAANGSLKGTLDHWYNLYDTEAGPNPAIGYCNNKWVVV